MGPEEPDSGFAASQRDLAQARQVRFGARTPVAASALVETIIGGPAAVKIKKFLRVNAILAKELPEALRIRISPVRLEGGIVTIEVADSVLLAELRNHHQHRLVAALVAGGSGANRITWRLAKTSNAARPGRR